MKSLNGNGNGNSLSPDGLILIFSISLLSERRVLEYSCDFVNPDRSKRYYYEANILSYTTSICRSKVMESDLDDMRADFGKAPIDKSGARPRIFVPSDVKAASIIDQVPILGTMFLNTAPLPCQVPPYGKLSDPLDSGSSKSRIFVRASFYSILCILLYSGIFFRASFYSIKCYKRCWWAKNFNRNRR